VANYIVDITVALKGSEKITRFNKQLQTSSRQIQAVNELVKVQEALVGALVKSFDNLSGNLALAKRNFDAVASGTRMQEKAARQLIKAEKDLNRELEQRDRLLNRLRGTGKMPLPGSGVGSDPVSKSIARRRRKLSRGANQYSSAAGPVSPFPNTGLVTGASSSLIPGQSLFGQSVNIERSLRERMAIQDKLFQMEIGQTEAAKERTKQLNKQNVELRRMKMENQQSLFNQYAGPIGPGQASPIMQGPQVSAEVQSSIMEQRRIQRRQDRLLRVRRGRDFQNRMRQAQSNALIGGAFPLLFGQGLGASIGGATGGAAGGAKGGQFGFALSLVGTVVGAQFDRLAQSARELGEALRNPIKNVDLLTQKIGAANTPFGDTISTLKDLGLEGVAAEAVLERFNQTFNTNRKTITELGEESIKFTNELQKLGTGITLLVAGPLTKFLQIVNDTLGNTTEIGVRRDAKIEARNLAMEKFGIGNFRAKRNVDIFSAIANMINPIPEIDGETFEEYARRIEKDILARRMNEAGLDGQVEKDLQRLIKERRDFELSSMKDQLMIEKQSLTMRSEDLTVLKRRMDLLKIEEKLKVKGLVNTKIMTAEQLRAHEFAIDKLEIEKQISEELLRQSIIMADPMKAAIVDLNKEIAKLNDLRFQAVEFAKAFGSAFEESFKGIVKGTMSVQDAFRNMFMRIADHFLDMAAQMMAAQISRGILGMFGNMFSAGTTDVFAGFNRGPTDPSTLTMSSFANGGRPPVGRPSLVGERGPELFVPDRAGTIIPNHAMGSTNIVVNVDASGSNVQGDEEQGKELGRLISVAVQSEIIQQQRPGGLLA